MLPKQPLRHLVGVEIGVFNGDNAAKIINYLNLKKIYLIDPWKEFIEIGLCKIAENQKIHDERFKFVKKDFKIILR